MIFNKGYSLKIDERRCLNRRHGGLACDHCLRHCPANAIMLNQGQVDIDRDLCSGCGLCLSDCPTQVFSSSQWAETSIIDSVKSRGWKMTEFFCARHSRPYQEHDTENRGALQLPACLTIVSRGAWYEMGLITAMELHLDQCEGCPAARTIERLELNIGIAAEWLAASGHTQAFGLIRSGSSGAVKTKLKAVETGFKVTSRRDLFLSLIARGQQQISAARKSLPEDNDTEILRHVVPDWLQRLSEVYTAPTTETAAFAFWPTIEIGSECVHCGMCTLFCPTGALQRAAVNGTGTYTFKSGLCLDCRICQLVCDHKAITRDKRPVAKPFDVAVIHQSPVLECKRCGGMTSDASTGLCYRCRKEAAIEREFKDACRALLIPSEK